MSNELSSTQKLEHSSKNYHISSELVVRLAKWRQSHDLVSAAELVETAIVDGHEGEAIDAARTLVTKQSNAAPLIRAHAASLLKRTGHVADVPAEIRTTTPVGATHWRKITRIHPQDALAWVELSLYQTIRGHKEHAVKSMIIALHHAPNNRHVLRSASRLFLHNGDPERAHDIILRNPATKTDPWLLAAEISFAKLADRSPVFYKIGLRIIDDGGLSHRQISELAGAVGTADLLDGNRKKSKKMFLQSVLDPTGNALAQAEWATPKLGSNIVPPGTFSHVLEAHEARALHFYREKEFNKVADACEKWALADPFSVRPLRFGSFAAGYDEDFEKSADFARRALDLRSGSDTGFLVNSLAFALASADKLDEAEKYLLEINVNDVEPTLRLHTLANWALIAFRRGLFEEGENTYLKVMDKFRKINKPAVAAHASVYLAREATRAGIPNAKKHLDEARRQMSIYPTEAANILTSLGQGVSTKPQDSPNSQHISKNFIHSLSENF